MPTEPPRRENRLRRAGRLVLVILAVLVGSTLGATLLVLSCAPTDPVPAPDPPAYAGSADTAGMVEARMHRVDYHVDPDIVLGVEELAGALAPHPAGVIPAFDDPTSFDLVIRSARIRVEVGSLARLLNRYVFNYRGSPIRDIRITVEGDRLRQEGTLGNVSFMIRSRAAVTANGEIRLHPTDIEVMGIGARGLMETFGLELETALRLRPGIGVRVEGNDLLLDPTLVVPPPRMRGTLSALELVPGAVILRFGPPDVATVSCGRSDHPEEPCMLFTGSRLRFGKLTMRATDLRILDQTPGDPFAFSLDRYHEQLVAGYHRTTPDDGLVVTMPDLGDLP